MGGVGRLSDRRNDDVNGGVGGGCRGAHTAAFGGAAVVGLVECLFGWFMGSSLKKHSQKSRCV